MSRSVLDVLRGVAKARAWWLTPWQQGGGDDSPQSALAHFVTASDGAEQAAATVERMAEALAITEPTQAMREAAYAQQAEFMRQLGEHCNGAPEPEDLFVLMWRAAIKAGPYEAALRAYRGEQA